MEKLNKAINKAAAERFMVLDDKGKVTDESTTKAVCEALNDFLDGMSYIRQMSYIVRAVMFYIQESSDSKHIKEVVQRTLERVIDNDLIYKEYIDNLSILNDGLLEALNE